MKLTKEEIQTFSDEPIELFYQGIKSPVTKKKYTDILRKMLCETLEDVLKGSFEQRAKQLVLESKESPEWATGVFLAIVKRLKERTQLDINDKNYLNPNSVPNFFKPLKKLFDMNGVPMSWPRVYASLPESNNNSEGRGYTRQEIQDLLKFAKGALDRAIILVAASSGIREGGFSLEWQDLKPVYKIDDRLVFEITESEAKTAMIACAMLLVYRNTNEAYPAFITPEAYRALMDYKMTWFKETGRMPKPTDPIFKNAGPSPRSLSPSGIRARIYRVAKSAGVWIPASGGKRRSEIPIMNGFRRFFNKVNKESVSRDSPLAALIKKEYMMAHVGLTKLDRNYFQAHTTELIEEYLNAVPSLTISNEERQKMKIENLETANSDLIEENKEFQILCKIPVTEEEKDEWAQRMMNLIEKKFLKANKNKTVKGTLGRSDDFRPFM